MPNDQACINGNGVASHGEDRKGPDEQPGWQGCDRNVPPTTLGEAIAATGKSVGWPGD